MSESIQQLADRIETCIASGRKMRACNESAPDALAALADLRAVAERARTAERERDAFVALVEEVRTRQEKWVTHASTDGEGSMPFPVATSLDKLYAVARDVLGSEPAGESS